MKERELSRLMKKARAWADSPEGKQVLGDVVKRVKQRELQRRAERAAHLEWLSRTLERRITI